MSDPLLALADELYALPLAEFTGARDALAKEHRGDKPFAAQIKTLRKPSVAAWVLNLLVRRDPEQVAQVVEVGEALRGAAESLDAAQLRELTKQRRQLTAAVTTTARRFARAEGVKVTQQVADQVEDTITAAMLDPDAAQALRSGLLVAAFRSTGVDEVDLTQVVACAPALGFLPTPQVIGAPDPDRPPELHVVPDPDAHAKAVAAADERIAAAQEEADSADDEVERSQSHVEELRARTLQLQAEIDELRARISEHEADLDVVDEDLAEAEEHVESAGQAATAAREELDEALRARERLDR